MHTLRIHVCMLSGAGKVECIDVALYAGAEQSQAGQGPARILEGSIARIGAAAAAAEMNVRELQ